MVKIGKTLELCNTGITGRKRKCYCTVMLYWIHEPSEN